VWSRREAQSSRSGSNEGTCVEVAWTWRKSSRSDSNEGSCVEVSVVDRGKPTA
jgi:hypothetical protein